MELWNSYCLERGSRNSGVKFSNPDAFPVQRPQSANVLRDRTISFGIAGRRWVTHSR